jgi:hypothetical protein
MSTHKQDKYTKGNGEMICGMERVNTHLYPNKSSFKELGKMDCSMATHKLITKRARSSVGSIYTTRKMVKELSSTKMEPFLMECSKMTKLMDMVSLLQRNSIMRVVFLMVSRVEKVLKISNLGVIKSF